MQEPVEWRDIDKYPKYQISNYGNVRQITENGFKEVKEFESKTSKGSYLIVVIENGDGESRFRGCHQLVCETYVASRESPDYVVNHKDGNKHNNFYKNLEWVTRSDNVLHALKSGLRDDPVPVYVKDVMEGTIAEYYSIIELSRQWKMPRYEMYKIIGRHREIPYKDRWTFEIDMETVGLVERVLRKSVMVFDHITRRWIIAPSLNIATACTGVSPTTISRAIWYDGQNPWGAFTFREYPSTYDIDPLPKEKALAQRQKFLNRRSLKRIGVILKNPRDGKVYEFKDRRAVTKTFPTINLTGLQSYFDTQRNSGKIKLYRGFQMKEKGDPRPFPEVSDIDVEKTILGYREDLSVFDVKNLEGNVERVYGASALAEKLGIGKNRAEKVKTETNIKGYTVIPLNV